VHLLVNVLILLEDVEKNVDKPLKVLKKCLHSFIIAKL